MSQDPRQLRTATDTSGLLPPLVELRQVTKRFPGVVALQNLDFDLRSGEVHALFGENGAGKSTLINIIAGTYAPDEGRFLYSGQPMHHLTPYAARIAGISPVFQEFSLAGELTVEQNLFLGREVTRWGVLDKRQMHTKARELLADLDYQLRPDTKVLELSRAEQQMIEIAKALLQDVKVLILDEPTSSLTEQEAGKLFDVIDRLKATGVGIVYVSHRLREVRQLADRVTVLRDGRKVTTVSAAEVDERNLVDLMAGRHIEMLYPIIDHRPTTPLLQAISLCTANMRIRGVDIIVHRGEIVGVAGLVGCGKSELARAIFGLEPVVAGEILIRGKSVARPTPDRMLREGICYFPSDRVGEGLALQRKTRENVSAAALDLPAFANLGFLRPHSERCEVELIANQMDIRNVEIERAVELLSGGNRQKVMLARGLTRKVDLFLFDEPTVGIDVGTKAQIYELMKVLTEGGAGVLLVSSELPEILKLSNRVYVVHDGAIVAQYRDDDINEENVLSSFFGAAKAQ